MSYSPTPSKAEDSTPANGDNLVPVAVQRQDTLGASNATDGKYGLLKTTAKDELYVKQTDAVPVTDNGGSLTVDNAGTFATQSAQSGTWTVQPGNTANTTAWKVDGSAVTQPVSGTVTANAGTNLNTSALALDATLTGGTQQAKLTDGTNVANNLKSDGTAAGQNSQLTAGTYLSIPFTTTIVANVASTDAGNYRWVSVDINTQGTSSTVTFQGSNDNSNWRSVVLTNTGAATPSGTTSTTTAAIMFAGPLSYRYFRLSVTGISAGTTAGTIIFSTLPSAAPYIAAGQAGTWTVALSANTPTLQSGSTTAVTQATGTNLHAVVDSGTITTVSAVTAITNALPAGSNLMGKVGIDQTTPGTTNAVVDTPVTTGGLSIITGSVGATATVIKASAGQLYGYHFLNTTAAVAYVQIFNVAAASVTLGTTAPTISVGIPANGGATVNFDKGIAFGTAMSYACTTTRTGLTGAVCDVNFFYK